MIQRTWRLSLLAGVLLLGGCYGNTGFNEGTRRGVADDDDAGDDDSSDDDDATDDDDGTDDDDAVDDDDAIGNFRILDLDPDHGSAEGGFNVEVEYDGDLSGLDNGDVTARFDATPATVLAVTDEFILVEAPSGCSVGDVELSITLSDGRDDSEEFEYESFADGLDTAIFTITKSLDATVTTPAEVASVTAKFFEPTTAPPGQGLPPLESCTSSIQIPPDTRSYFSVGAGVDFTNGSVTVPVTYQTLTGWYEGSNFDGSFFPPTTTWSVTGAVDPLGCTMNLATVVSAPEDPLLVQPAPVGLDCWTMAAFLPGVVEWSAPITVGPDDGVLIQIVNATTGGGLVCHASDDGAFLVAHSDMLLLTEGLQRISVIRYRPLQTVVEPSGATVHGTYSSDFTGLLGVQINYGTFQECP